MWVHEPPPLAAQDPNLVPDSFRLTSSLRRVLTTMSKPYVWVHKLVAQDRTGHMESVRGALYNATFDVVVRVWGSGSRPVLSRLRDA